MRRINSFLVPCILALISACNAQVTPTPSPQPTTLLEVISTPTTQSIPLTEADVPRASLEQAVSALRAGAAVMVDVRSIQAFESSHIEGAISIPLTEIEADPNNLPLEKDQWIITYCTWQNEHTSARAAFILLNNGYTKVTPLLGGFHAWLESGLPVKP